MALDEWQQVGAQNNTVNTQIRQVKLISFTKCWRGGGIPVQPRPRRTST